MDEYRILAEHFGKSENIRVVISGKEAKIEGDTIYLPENVPEDVQGVLLSTLLHESYHKRFTDRDNVDRLVDHSAHKKNVLECLEDIRLNSKIFTDWPNAKNLYHDLHDYYEAKHGDEYGKLPWQVQAVRKLIFRAYGDAELFEKFESTDPKVAAWWAKHKDFAAEVIAEAKGAPDTEALVPLVDKILKRLFPEDEKRDKQRQQAEQKGQEQGKQGGEARKDQKGKQDAGKEAFQKAKDLDNKAREQEKDAAREKAQGKQADGEAKKREGEGDKDGAKQKRDEAKKHQDKAKGHEQKAENLNKQAEPHYKDLEKKQNEFKAAKQKAEKCEANVQAAQAEVAKMDQDAEQEQAEGCNGLDKIGVGFDRIDQKDFQVRNVVPQNIEDDVLEFLKNRVVRTIHSDQGKIDAKKLPTFFSPDTLFKTTVDDGNDKTRIHFLVDISGSMCAGLDGDGGGRKSVLATEAVLGICKAIERGIAEGLDLEYGIFGFDTEAHEVKAFEDALDKEQVKKGLAPRGGTDPRAVIEQIETQHQPNNASTKQVVFMISDGQFGGDAYSFLEQRLGGHIQWVFLGIDASAQYDERSRELFGKYNVKRAQDLKKSLGRALIDNMR